MSSGVRTRARLRAFEQQQTELATGSGNTNAVDPLEDLKTQSRKDLNWNPAHTLDEDSYRI
jgi:hypothetical protein